MQLIIDPTNPVEARAALRMLRALGTVEAATLHPDDNPEAGTDAAPKGSAANPYTEADARAHIGNDTSAAAVFGSTVAIVPPGAIPLAPADAPSTAGVGQSPNVPEVPTAGVPMPPTGSQLPAPPTGSGAGVPTGLAAPTNPVNGVEVDADGLPWDERIHAGTKRKNADKRWTAKRGLNDPVFLSFVQNELRARMAASTPPNGLPPMPSAPPAGPAAGQGLPPVPPPPAAPPVAAPPAAPTGVPQTFEDFMMRVSAAMMAGALPPSAAQTSCTLHGLASVTALQAAPQHVPTVWAHLVTQYPALG